MPNTNNIDGEVRKPRALLLGMIYSQETRPKRGQGIHARMISAINTKRIASGLIERFILNNEY